MISIANNREEDLFVTTVRRVADEIGVDPVELPPLYDTIDPTLIDSLPELATLSFPYQGYTVVVQGDGAVTVRESLDGEQKGNA